MQSDIRTLLDRPSDVSKWTLQAFEENELRGSGAVPISKARDEFTGRCATSRGHVPPSIAEEKRLHLVIAVMGGLDDKRMRRA